MRDGSGSTLTIYERAELKEHSIGELQGLEPPKTIYELWRHKIIKRIVVGSLMIISGIAIIIASVQISSPGTGVYRHANATYLGQRIQDPLWFPLLHVKVRFKTNNKKSVTAFIEPSETPARSTILKPIPILYRADNPTTAFYAGPGGDARYTSSNESGILAGSFLTLIGLLLLTNALIKRQRIISASREQEQIHVVHLRWQMTKSNEPTMVIVTDPQECSDYSWQVFPEAPKPGILRRLTRTTPCPDTALNKVTRFDRAELAGKLGPHRWIVLRTADELIIPLSRAEPIVGSSPPPRPLPLSEATTLVRAHRSLLAAYAGVCSQARLLPQFIRPPGAPLSGIQTLLCYRPLVRLHVESHIRRQLRQLADAYLRAQMLISETSADQRRQISSLREECQQLSNSLLDIPRRIAASLVGVAALAPVIPLLIKTPQVSFSQFVEIILPLLLYVLLFLPGIFALLAYNDTFRCKRQLFMSYNTPATQKARSAHQNIYQLETAVFDLLRQPKRLERMPDCWANIVVLAIGTVVFMLQLVPVVNNSYGLGTILRIILYVLLAFCIVYVTRMAVANLLRRLRQER